MYLNVEQLYTLPRCALTLAEKCTQANYQSQFKYSNRSCWIIGRNALVVKHEAHHARGYTCKSCGVSNV